MSKTLTWLQDHAEHEIQDDGGEYDDADPAPHQAVL